jgi:hypothetical protein
MVKNALTVKKGALLSDALIRVKTAADTRLWIPGHGLVEAGIARASKIVEDYDEKLMLARHEVTGDWCVFLKKGPFGEPFPVIGLGKELPSSQEITDKLLAADTSRRGDQILRDLNAHNERLREPKRSAADTASGIAAEALEWGFRKQGAHPIPRIFVPRTA